jgi:hypothetical protein
LTASAEPSVVNVRCVCLLLGCPEADLRRLYIKYIYPQLRQNQSVVLVPGAFSSVRNSVCVPLFAICSPRKIGPREMCFAFVPALPS